jgi:hypothetical protein
MSPVPVASPPPPVPVPIVNDAIGPAPFPGAPPGFVIRAVLWLRKKLLDAAYLLGPPELRVFDLSMGGAVTQLLGLVCRHNIPDLLADGPLSAAELAARTGLDADALHRFLRGLACIGVFTMDSAGRVANNRYSSALRDDRLEHFREHCIYFSSESNLRSWSDIEATARTGKNAFERLHGMSVWDWFEHHPDERETFARMMMGGTIAVAPTVAAIYPWREIERVCDVGGGRGTLISELLVRHPHLQGVLCDAAGVLDSARVLLEKRGVLARVQLVPGSFFDHVPGGADAYVLKNILHDWDDARSLHILGVVRRAMQKGQRLVIAENITEHNDAENFGALSDVHMMTVCSDGRERSRAEYERLLGKSGFVAGRVNCDSPLINVIEGIAD